jgi:hypothetical protein
MPDIEPGVVQFFDQNRGFGKLYDETGALVFFRSESRWFVDFEQDAGGIRHFILKADPPNKAFIDRAPNAYDDVYFERTLGRLHQPRALRWFFRDELERIARMANMDVMASLDACNSLEPELPNWLAWKPVPKRHD